MKASSVIRFPLFTIALLCLGVLALSPGCTTKPRGIAQRTLTFTRPFKQTWNAVVAEALAFDTNAIADPLGRTVSLPNALIRQDSAESFANNPSAIHSWTTMRLHVNVEVIPKSSNETTVTIACRYFRMRNLDDDRWYSWPSTGKFERELLARIYARLER
jgi:hypothetical protein